MREYLSLSKMHRVGVLFLIAFFMLLFFNSGVIYAIEIIQFYSDIETGSKPLKVTFTCYAFSNEPIVSYQWDFDGDGNVDQITSTGTVTYTYTKAGVYKATVTVFDDKGTLKKSNPIIISVALWRFKIEDNTDFPAIGNDGTIYIGSDDYLYAINPDGTLKWKFEIMGYFSSLAIGEDETIYIIVSPSYYIGAYLYAINPDGSLKWKSEIMGHFSSPAIGKDGTIYIGSSGTFDSYLYAINPDGSLKWKFKTNLTVSSPAIGENGTIYVGSDNSYLYAINPDGSLKWKFKTNATVSSPAIGENGTIYVGSDNSYLYAINPDGSLKWKFKTNATVSSPAIGENGTIYVGSDDGYLYAINPDGSLKWKFKTNATVSSPAIGENGTIYVGSDDGYLYAINPDGSLKWKFKTNATVSSPAIGENGTIYVGSDDGYLYAIYSDSKGLAHSFWPMYRHDIMHTGRVKGQTLSNQAPVIDSFDADPKQGNKPLKVTFTCEAYDPDGSIVSYKWDFDGDGTFDQETDINIVTYTYTASGTYTATVTVFDDKGALQKSEPLTIKVSPTSENLNAYPELALQFLKEVMDEYHTTFDVYTDLSAAGNHFVMLGRLGVKATINVASKESPLRGDTCIENQFTGTEDDWGGWYFMNGVLEGREVAPKLNWGTYPDAGFNLTGAKKLTFWARGKKGGERVEFFAFGIGRNPFTGEPIAPYPDSSPKKSTGYITLTKEWKQYSLDLTSLDLSYVIGGFGWVTNAPNNNNRAITFYLDDIRYQKSRLDEPRFLLSYKLLPTDKPILKNTAFIYDNALALLAFLASKNKDNLRRAKLIGDAISYAIDHDRFFTDGRIRNAYQAADLKLFPGWKPYGKANTVRMPGWWDNKSNSWYEDEYCVSTYTGNVAWAMIALISLYEDTKEQKYLNKAITLGEWIEKNCKDNRGSGGYTGGYNGWAEKQTKIFWKSTEHNIDIYVAFMRLYKITGNEIWKQRALHAKAFVEAMWDKKGNHFWTGTLEDGVTINKSNIPVDIQAWAVMALGERYKKALEWAENNCLLEDNGFKGFDFNNDKDGIWFEGTAHMALAYQLIGERQKAEIYVRELEHAQKNALNTDGKGLVAASHDGLSTGFDWIYDARLHTGATSWFIFAELGYNPYWNTWILPGDVNGDGKITIYDAILILKVISRQEVEKNLHNFDVTGDKKLDLGDAIYVLRKIAGLL
ncbi:hypothetical protein JCM12298_20170 [Desulfothermus naphthae]